MRSVAGKKYSVYWECNGIARNEPTLSKLEMRELVRRVFDDPKSTLIIASRMGTNYMTWERPNGEWVYTRGELVDYAS